MSRHYQDIIVNIHVYLMNHKTYFITVYLILLILFTQNAKCGLKKKKKKPFCVGHRSCFDLGF